MNSVKENFLSFYTVSSVSLLHTVSKAHTDSTHTADVNISILFSNVILI